MNRLFKIWAMRLIYAALGILVLTLPLLPLQCAPARIMSPDLFFCLTVAWVIRQPAGAPLLLVAALALLGDAILMRPPGLWALLLVIVTEVIRATSATIRQRGLLFELGVVAFSLFIMIVVQNVALFVTFADPLAFPRLLQFVLITLICYPITVFILYYGLRIRGVDLKKLPDRLGKIK